MISHTNLFATAVALLLFPLVVFVPGYVAGWLLDAFSFRRRTLSFRVPAALVLSVSLTPILFYLIGRLSSGSVVLGVCGVFWLMAASLAAGSFGHPGLRSVATEVRAFPKAALWIAAIWASVTLLALSDVSIRDRLYFSVIVYDHSLRAAVTDAITRTGVPPDNPFYHLTGATPLRYHYFWFAVCSAIDKLGGDIVDARDAINAGAVWCGLSLMSIVALYLRLFETSVGPIRKRALLGIALLGITGLDLIPSVLSWARHRPSPEMEWWNEQVGSWVGSTLWVPHNIAAVIAAFTAFLLLWYGARECSTFRARAAHVVLAAVAFASSTGLALYVAMVFAASMITWLACLCAKRWWVEARMLTAAGAIAAMLSLPFLASLSGAGTGGSLLVFYIRDFFPLGVIMNALHGGPRLFEALRLMALPLNYFLEFGFFFAVAAFKLIRLRRLRDQDVAALAIVLPALVLCSFWRSGVISNNDFGWRGLLSVQFILLLWAVDFLLSDLAQIHAGLWRATVLLLLVIGGGGTLYELGINRFYFPLADAGVVPPFYTLDRNMGKRAYAMRSLYEELRTTLDKRSILEINPDWPKDDLYFGLYSRRQMAAAGRTCGTSFGGDSSACLEALPALNSIFKTNAAIDPERLRVVCSNFGIDAVIVADTDPVWREEGSWIWKAQPLASNNYARAFRCGANTLVSRDQSK